MDGKIFLYSNGTPPRIAFSPDAFTFDLQRFALSTTNSDSATFSAKIGKTTYYGENSDFKSGNVTVDGTKVNLANATEITLLADVTFSSSTSSGITLKETCILNLGSHTLTYNSTYNKTSYGIKTVASKKLTVQADAMNPGSIATNSYLNPTDNKNKTRYAIQVASNSTLELQSGQLTGNSGAVTNSGTFTQSGGTISGTVTNSGTLNVNGGTISGTVTNSGALTQSGGTTTNTVTNKAGATFNKTGGDNYYVNNVGTFDMSGGSAWVDNFGTFNMTNGTAKGIRNSGDCSIAGGTLNTDQFEYVADGVKFVVLDGKVYVGEQAINTEEKHQATVDGITKYYTNEDDATAAVDNVVASIGEVKYSSLQKAVNLATTGSTIKLLNDVTNQIIFNNGKDLTLDLNGHDVSYPDGIPIIIGNQYADSVENTKLTIIGKGNITGTYGISVMGGNCNNTGKTYSTLVLGKGDGTDDIKVTANDYFAVWGNGNHNGNGGDNCGTDITINAGVILDGGTGAGIYNPQTGKLTINGGTITGTTGVEIRAGELNVTGGTITGTGTEYNSVGNSNGSTSSGVGIAIAQHTTKKAIEVKISGEPEISGAVALGVANPQGNGDESDEIKVNIDGGTFTSTRKDEAAISAQNSDERVSITINKGTFIGDLKSTFATTSDEKSAGITITGEVTVTDSKGNTNKYNANSLQYELENDKYITVAEGWNKVNNEWIYFVRESVGSVKAKGIANLTPASASEDETTLKLTITPEFGGTVELDFNSDLFKGAKYTTVDASSLTADYPLKITAGDVIKNIIGGAGNDTLTASSLGAVLNGSAGDNLLQGGDGKDTFIHKKGTPAVEASGSDPAVDAAPVKDTIDNYKIADDIVSLTNELPTDLANGISYNNTLSEFVISLGGGAGDSLTFHSASEIKFKRYNGTGDDTYYYRADRVIKNDAEATLGAAFSDKTFDLNKLSTDYVDYSKVATIDASAVTVSGGLNIIANTVSSSAANSIKSAQTGGTVIGGNNDNTLISAVTGEASLTFRGGEGNDSLVGGGSSKDLFIYTGGADSISGYASGTDLVRVNNSFRLAEATVSVGTPDASNGQASISLTFDNANSLIFEGIGVDDKVRVQQGTNNNYYTYAQQYSAHNNSITLASGYTGTFNGADENYKNYETINAAAVTAENGISIVGNDNANYIFGPTAVNASIYGGANNDKINVSDRGTDASYLFEYTAGKDEIIGFDATKDTVSIAVANITAAKASNSKLALTVDKNKNVLTLRGEDEIEKVSLAGDSADYLTKDGYVKGQGFSLFGSARGSIDLKDALYTGSSISLVAADSVKSQSVTLTGGEKGGTFIYAPNNKKRDGFIYGGGAVSISGYEAGRDRIDLGTASLSSFSVGAAPNGEVILKVGDGTNSGTISISGAGGQEVLLHDTSKGNGYKKMVFAKTGVIENKAKNPTIVTVSGAADDYSAADTPTIKKIYVTGIDREGFSVQAGDRNNTQIDASAAGKAISLSGGAKNDKLIGSSENDLFVYSAGKDVLQGYGESDRISILGGLADSLGSAKITAGSKSIKFQFTNKNTLTLKANSGEPLSNTLNINGEEKTYAKNAIESGGQATLTSAFSGTFNTASTKGIAGAVSTVNGAAVSRNLTYKGSTSAESLVGGTRKTTFKGGGGNDTLVGGSGKDIFFYAKNDAGTTTIADFDFGTNGRAGNDKLKIASGTISEIKQDGNNVQFAMNTGKNTANVGWFQVTSGQGGIDIDATKVAIKANNTYYWFADAKGEDVNGNAVEIGQLITSDSRVSASDVSSYSVIDLNYTTNLAKAGVAVKVANAKPTNS